MQVKIHKSYRDVVAVCDSNLLGKKFEEGNRQLKIRPNFYEGKETSKDKLLKLIQQYSDNDATFNIVGQESTQTALEAGIIKEEGIAHIQDVPFALVLL